MSDHTSIPVSFSPSDDDSRSLPEIIAERYGFSLAFHDQGEQRFYAVLDWIRGVAQPQDPHKFWDAMKRRHPFLTNLRMRFRYRATDAKYYFTDYVDRETLYVIAGFMSSGTGIARHVMSGVVPTDTKPKEGYVYLIGVVEHVEYYKIGQTKNLEKRLASIDSGMPFTPILIHSILVDSPSLVERCLHMYFQSKRIKKEWFKLTSNDINVVKNLSENQLLNLVNF